MADDDRRSHGQAHERHGNDIERLRAVAHGGDAGRAAKLSHHVQVGHAVEHLQKVREHIGQGKDRDGLEDVAACEVVFHGRGTFWLGSFSYQCSENPITIVESRFVLRTGRKSCVRRHFQLNVGALNHVEFALENAIRPASCRTHVDLFFPCGTIFPKE